MGDNLKIGVIGFQRSLHWKHPLSKYKPLIYLLITSVITILIIAIAILRKGPIEIRYTRPLMGTLVEITLVGGDEKTLKEAAEQAFLEIERLEAMMSHYKEDSELSMINRMAGRGAVQVSPELLEVIEEAMRFSELSGGAFDVTMGVLGRVWDFGTNGEKAPPHPEVVKALLPLIDYRQITIDRGYSTVKLNKAGMIMNLGGIAKGYIVKRAVEAIKARGIKKGIVHAGGDMVVFQGTSEPPFRVGIKHPRKMDSLLGTILVSSGAIATSGDYERFFIKDGVRYNHIMDPTTGFPAGRCQSVTIIGRDATTADALSTAVFVMGPDKGMALIEGLPDIEGVIVDAGGKVSISSGLKGRVEIFE